MLLDASDASCKVMFSENFFHVERSQGYKISPTARPHGLVQLQAHPRSVQLLLELNTTLTGTYDERGMCSSCKSNSARDYKDPFFHLFSN